MRPLPDQDLARIAPMPRDQKLVALRRMKFGRPPYSYKPVRGRGLAILGVAPGPLLAETPRASLAIIEASIRGSARSLAEMSANLEVARGLYAYAEAERIIGRREEFRPFPVGLTENVSY